MSNISLLCDLFCRTKSENLYYKAKDEETGLEGNYVFMIIQLKDKTWRAYVLETPSLNGRNAEGTIVHLYLDKNANSLYICVVEDIYSKEKIIAVAKLWARKFQRYIATGKKYDE